MGINIKNMIGVIDLIGISFEVPNEYGKILGAITTNVDVEKYFWYNVEAFDQTFKQDITPPGDFLFKKETYNGHEFIDIINSHEYYTVFSKLQAYLKEAHYREINTYDEYINSDCEILIIIVDCIFVDIFAKDVGVLKKVEEIAIQKQFKNIVHIETKNIAESGLG